MTALTRVKRATSKRQASEAEWRDAIRAAVHDGFPLRTIGEAAGVSHVRVLQIVREK